MGGRGRGGGRAVQRITHGAVSVALGVLFPTFFHMVGAGRVFLPMHIPVLLAGLLAGPTIGAVVGVVAPLLSALLTGMPSLMPPTAQAMTVELGVYGFLSGLLHVRLRQNVAVALLGAMIGGRLVYGMVAAYVLPLFGLDRVPVLYPLTAGVASSLPGVLLQLVVVPTVVYLAERTLKRGRAAARQDRARGQR